METGIILFSSLPLYFRRDTPPDEDLDGTMFKNKERVIQTYEYFVLGKNWGRAGDDPREDSYLSGCSP